MTTGNECIHYWYFPTSEGTTAIGTCKKCGATQKADNYMDIGVDNHYSVSHHREAQKFKEFNAGHYQPKVPKEQYEIIYKRWKAGESQAQIAKDYNVNRSTISNVLKKREAEISKPPTFQELITELMNI